MRILLITVMASFMAAACSSSGSKQANKDTAEKELPAATENIASIHLDVKGMTCEGCENAVVLSIRKLDGIREAKASHTAEEAIVSFDSTRVSVDAIAQAIADAGYSVKGEKTNPHH